MSKTKAPAKKASPKTKAGKPAKKPEPSKNGKLSAIDAAAKVLGEAKEPMNTFPVLPTCLIVRPKKRGTANTPTRSSLSRKLRYGGLCTASIGDLLGPGRRSQTQGRTR